jgi:hypothetical protein
LPSSQFAYAPAVAVALGVCLACSGLPNAGEFQVGASRSELLKQHGAPIRQQTLVKRDNAIWGPIEDFWQQVPVGSSVEIWAYPAEGGTVELYFVDGSDHVQGTGLAPQGAVFEGGP